jgi:Alpha/beta hydrolase of unknown function (DUF1400)
MFWHSVRFTALVVVFLALCPRSPAAESAIIRYSIFEKSVSVAELSRLSETGEVDPALEAQLKMVNQNPEKLRRLLNQKIPADPVLLSKVLNSFVGKSLLDYASEIIHTPSRSASRQALRGALITSALDDKEIQLIEVLENYPTAEVHLDGERLLDLINRIQGLMKNIPRLPF